MKTFSNDDFDLDELLLEIKNKNNKSSDIKFQEHPKDNVDNVNDSNKPLSPNDANNKNFNLNIDFSSIDSSLSNINDDIISDNSLLTKKSKYKHNIPSNTYLPNSTDILDNDSILNIIKINKRILTIKISIIITCLILSISSFFCDNTYITLSVNLIALSSAILTCNEIIINGFKSLFSKNGSFESLISILCFATIVQNSLLFSNLDANLKNNLFSPSVIIILLFSTISKIFINSNMKITSKFAMSNLPKYSINEKTNSNDILNPEQPTYSYSYEKCESHQLSLNPFKYGNTTNNILIYSLTIIPTIISFITYNLTNNISSAINSFIILIILSCPISSDFCPKYIINRFVKKLYKNKIAIEHYSIIEKLNKNYDVVINNSDMFIKENFKLIKMKFFDHNQVNTSIIDIASVLYNANSILSKVFLDIINNRTNMLKNVSNITKEPEGFTANVENRLIILGSSDFLLDNNIAIPSKYLKTSDINDDLSSKIIFVSIDGSLTAMFLIKISPFNKIISPLQKLFKNHHASLTIKLVDPLISKDNICYIYNIDNNYINTINDFTTDNIESNYKQRLGLIFSGHTPTFIDAINYCSNIKTSITLSFVIQLISISLGCCFVATFSLLNSLNLINFPNLILMQTFWFLIILLIPRMGDIR